MSFQLRRRFAFTLPLTALSLGASLLITGGFLAGPLASRAIAAPIAVQVPIPAGGESLLPEDALSAFGQFGQKDATTFETVPVTGQPFMKAIRATTVKAPTNQWEAQLGTWIQKPVKKGDTLLLSFYVHARKGQAETGEARTNAGFSTGGPDWSNSVSEAISIPSEWKRIDIPFVARYDTPVTGSIVAFDMGYAPQSFEIGGITLINYGTTKSVADLPRTSNEYAGQEDNAPWRKLALDRIEKLRKGDLAVTVANAAGKPVPNATVSVRMRRHVFRFGNIIAADTFLQPGATSDKYRAVALNDFSSLTVENHMKWPFWESSWGRGDADKSTDALVANEMPMPIAGPLVWGGWTNLPDDMKAHQDDKEYLWKRISEHIPAQMGAYQGKVREWEVINEPFAQNDLWKIFGYARMADVFRMARKVDPTARLTINDYPALDGAATNNEHLNAYYKYIADLQAAKAPLDGIGFQCHFGSAVVPPERVLSGLDRFAKFGLPISITEFDMNTADEDLQRRYMRDFLTACFSHPSVDAVIQWGFWEGKHWMPNAALYRWDWSLKPNGQVYKDLVLRDWWTNADGKTNATGVYKTRAFYGIYEITATAPNGKSKTSYISLTKDKPGPFTVTLNDAPVAVPKWIAVQKTAELERTAKLTAGLPLVNGQMPLNLLADKANGTAEEFTSGQPFGKATRFHVTKATPNPWEVQALAVTTDDIKKGDVLRVSFYVRGANGGKVTASFQTGAPDYRVFHAEAVTPTSTWKRIELPFIAEYDSTPGNAALVFQLGHQVQTVEIGGISVLNFGSKANISKLPPAK